MQRNLVSVDAALTLCFIVEAVIKIFAWGLLCECRGAYLRDAWNALDLMVGRSYIVATSFASHHVIRASCPSANGRRRRWWFLRGGGGGGGVVATKQTPPTHLRLCLS